MSTSFFVPGPALVSVSTGGTDVAPTYEFLGYTEGPVEPEIDGLFADEPIDYAGMAPGDVNFQGEIAVIPMVLKRFDAAVLKRAIARVRGATAGTINACEIGTLMATEKKTVGLIVKAPYVACKSTLYGTAVAGVRFPTAYVAGPFRMPHSTRAQRFPLTFRAFAFLDPTKTNSTDTQGVLYDFDTSLAATPT